MFLVKAVRSYFYGSPQSLTTAATMATASSSAGSYTAKVEELVRDNNIMVFSKSYCPYCTRAKNLLNEVAKGKKITVLELDKIADGAQYQQALAQLTGRNTVPNIYLQQKNVGGCDDIVSLHRNGRLVALL